MSAVLQQRGELSDTSGTVVLNVAGMGGVAIQVAGTFSATVAFTGSADGVTYVALSAAGLSSGTAVSSTTGAGVFLASVTGLTTVRCKCSAYTSGSAQITLQAVPAAPGGSGSGGGGGGGAVTIADGADIAEGATTDVAVTGDNDGTVNSHLRGIDTILADVWDSVGHALDVNASVSISGVATEAAQTDGSQKTQIVDGSGNVIAAHVNALDVSIRSQAAALTVDGSGVTQPVSAASLPLPTGAATAAKQPALGTAGTASTDVITVQGIAAMTALKVDGSAVTQPVSGTFWQATQPVSAASLPLPTGASTLAEQQTQSTSLATLAGAVSGTEMQVDVLTMPSVTVTATNLDIRDLTSASDSVAAVCAGDVAADAADSGNPVKVGGKAVSAEPTAVTANDRANFITDLVGKQIVLPYANPENFVSGCITSAMTGTTSTSLVAAPAAGLRNYLTQITVSNTHGTVGTNIEIQDGNGGTTFYIIPAAAVYGGATLTFPTPLRQPTTATALYCKNTTTGASTFVSASGYKGA